MVHIAAMLVVMLMPFQGNSHKPSRPTARDFADGELMLFDNETTFGWLIEGEVKVSGGWMILGGTKATTATSTTAFPIRYVKWQLDYPEGLSADKRPTVSIGEKAAVAGFPDKVIAVTSDGKVERVKITVPAGTTALVGRVTVLPVVKDKLFTGKNLDGWKVNAADPKRMASKWEVTKDGELSVKNGPGDLVSEKEFDNFVLQFECKTLGKALNSGIFFRCIPGQYQNGYEAQIQNAFVGEDRTKPADFGTGAIYRRVPARKVVSNDNEWFTMTVVADGKHISTWVNGYQTVDWTDDRKDNDNPRQGYRAAKGPLSIQGHDPTTDLLFRNIRIAELPAKK